MWCNMECVSLLCWFILMNAVSQSHILREDTESTLETKVVLAGVARLPCDLAPPTSEDRVLLVIWYKDVAKSPIYSLDVRGRSLAEATHWADETTLGGRSFFRVEDTYTTDSDEREDGLGTHLVVENVREMDAGSYRCRVDFKHSPTRNSVVNLTVIVPSNNVTILDARGEIVTSSTIGPYAEGSMVQVTCIVYGGRPSPRVTWWHDDELMDDSDEKISEHRVKNVLHLGRLERHHLQNVFTCMASIDNMLSPISNNLTLDMYLRPLDTRLLGENQPLSASSSYEVACQTSGSKPPAHITWWKGGVLLDTSRETTSLDDNVTTSILTLTPTVDDQGRDLSCRANNSLIPNSAMQDTWKLNIHYRPIVSLKLGKNLNGSLIREGMDVYLECNTKANPWIYRIVWRHNGTVLENDSSVGMAIVNQTLTLQSVGRGDSGLYTCVVSNVEGDSESNTFYLIVKYEPVCSSGQRRVYGAARLEQVEVTCDVDANPVALLFRWSFNNSAMQSLEVGTIVSAPGGGRSVATYIPQSERDYGTLMCWGRNELGPQETPCVFHVVPAGRPDPPRNCAVVSRTANSLQVSCARGFDGGLPQELTLELYVAVVDAARRLVSNVTIRSKSDFTVTGLEPGTAYDMLVYSSNGKGKSEREISLKATTLKTTQQEHRKTPTDSSSVQPTVEVTPLQWVLAGVIGTLILVAVVLVPFLRWRSVLCDCCDPNSDERQSNTGTAPNDPDKELTVALTVLKTPAAEDVADNPDVIPHTSDTDISYPNYVIAECMGSSRLPFNADIPARPAVYSSAQVYSRPRNTGCPVQWQLTGSRDVSTQSRSHVPVVIVVPPEESKRQNAETQTPLPARQRESTV